MPLDIPQEKQDRLDQIIFRIGSKPGFLSRLNGATERQAIQEYLNLKGLSIQSVVKARDESLIKAYNVPAYFSAWLESEKNKANNKAANRFIPQGAAKPRPVRQGPELDLNAALNSNS